MSDLVGNPEDRFSRVAAQLVPRTGYKSVTSGRLDRSGTMSDICTEVKLQQLLDQSE